MMTEVEKACAWCEQVKPVSAFSVRMDRLNSYHSYCKACRNSRATMAALRKCGGRTPKKQSKQSPDAWKRPRDDRPIQDKLRDVQLGKMRRYAGALPGLVGATLGLAA